MARPAGRARRLDRARHHPTSTLRRPRPATRRPRRLPGPLYGIPHAGLDGTLRPHPQGARPTASRAFRYRRDANASPLALREKAEGASVEPHRLARLPEPPAIAAGPFHRAETVVQPTRRQRRQRGDRAQLATAQDQRCAPGSQGHRRRRRHDRLGARQADHRSDHQSEAGQRQGACPWRPLPHHRSRPTPLPYAPSSPRARHRVVSPRCAGCITRMSTRPVTGRR